MSNAAPGVASLLDDLAAPAPTRKGPTCTVGRLLTTLSPIERDRLQAALDDPDWTSAHLTRVLGKHGTRMAPQTIQRHRRGECLCRSLTT